MIRSVIALAVGVVLALVAAAPLAAAPGHPTQTTAVQPIRVAEVDIVRDTYTVTVFGYWDAQYPAPAPAPAPPAPVLEPGGLYEVDDPAIHPWPGGITLVDNMPRGVYP